MICTHMKLRKDMGKDKSRSYTIIFTPPCRLINDLTPTQIIQIMETVSLGNACIYLS